MAARLSLRARPAMVDRSPTPVTGPSGAFGTVAPADGRRATPGRRLVVGAVSYLNTRPLVHGLASPTIDLRFDLPSRLADGLAAGRFDVALIPTIELFRGIGYTVVSDACIGCRGPVMSVKVFFRTAPERVQTMAIDEGSRTSVALASILLAERCGVRPRTEILPIGGRVSDTAADAVLVIGDRALGGHGGPAGDGGSFQLVWDLGDEWCRWTGLPFVFAVWAARPGIDGNALAALEVALAAARDRGRRALAGIAATEAAAHGLTVAQCLGYLHDNLHYDLGTRERQALGLFADRAAALGLAPPVPAVRGPSTGAPAASGSAAGTAAGGPAGPPAGPWR
ncbi:MAG: menaquinone biosynthetic enzyme MqnA/MqnD family protein [Pirellulales bacterium]